MDFLDTNLTNETAGDQQGAKRLLSFLCIGANTGALGSVVWVSLHWPEGGGGEALILLGALYLKKVKGMCVTPALVIYSAWSSTGRGPSEG